MLIYPLTFLINPPTAIWQNIQLEIFKFIWDAKADTIKRSVLYQDCKNGWLRLINLENFIKALKAGWTKCIFDEQNNGLWQEYYIEKLNGFGGKLILQSNLDIKDCSQISKVHSFLHDILGSWCKINVTTDTSAVSKDIVWNNSEIKHGNKTLVKELSKQSTYMIYRIKRYLHFWTIAKLVWYS